MIPNEPNSADATDMEGGTAGHVEGAAPDAGIANPDAAPSKPEDRESEDGESIEAFIERLLDGYVSPPLPVLPKSARRASG